MTLLRQNDYDEQINRDDKLQQPVQARIIKQLNEIILFKNKRIKALEQQIYTIRKKYEDKAREERDK